VKTQEELLERFWKAYPRKVGKEYCIKIFKRKKYSEEVVDQMVETIEKYKKTQQWQNKNLIPHPSTFLNQGRWEDEVTEDLMVTNQPQNERDELMEIMNAKRKKMWG